ncbi:MAG: Cthe_2314 family HEPN domain-containing protein [Candidatus Pristimantibacillus sp.]
MDYIKLEVENKYLERAHKELNLPDFPSMDIIDKLYDAMDRTMEKSQKFMSMTTWIKLLEKKYKETSTSVAYGLAHFYKQQEERQHNPHDPFYHPSVSFFTENAVSRSFSLGDKLAQLINVFEDKGVQESGNSNSVSFYKIKNMTPLLINLDTLDEALQKLKIERHIHVHGLNPEMIRNEVLDYSRGSINGNDVVNGKPVEIFMLGINEAKMPVVPYQQLIKCKEVLTSFQTTISDVILKIEQSL